MYVTSVLKKILCMLRHLCLTLPSRQFWANKPEGSVVPDNFDWEFYLDFHSDLRQAGLKTKKDAISHYSRHGFYEKRIIRLQDKTLIEKNEQIRPKEVIKIKNQN